MVDKRQTPEWQTAENILFIYTIVQKLGVSKIFLI